VWKVMGDLDPVEDIAEEPEFSKPMMYLFDDNELKARKKE
jgi:hypothetical protein